MILTERQAGLVQRLAATAVVLLVGPLALGASPQSSPTVAAGRRQLAIRTPGSRAVQFGVASWYGPGLQRRITAGGSSFDDRQLTAAHRTLPLGTRVKVTNLRNGRSVVVRVTDRGPWVRGRLIDLSRAAAERLGFRHRGITRVKVAVVKASSPRATDARTTQRGPG